MVQLLGPQSQEILEVGFMLGLQGRIPVLRPLSYPNPTKNEPSWDYVFLYLKLGFKKQYLVKI